MHTSDDTPTDRTRRLEKIAHRIWVEEGRPHGRDRAHWAAAEAELEALEAANRSVPETGRAAGPEDGPYEAGPTLPVPGPPVPGPPVPGSPAPSAAEPGPAAPETRTRQRLAAAKTAETKASAGATRAGTGATRATGAGTRRAKGGTDAAPTATADAPKKAGTKPATRSRTRRPAGDA
ncbi:DUF2934 domain-containing protein [Tistrella mobilis]|uniref:DUF2934 domain-containing protein n=1 Tax=Tistrella mobilis TaxID=171437 RepID=UPI00320095A8